MSNKLEFDAVVSKEEAAAHCIYLGEGLEKGVVDLAVGGLILAIDAAEEIKIELVAKTTRKKKKIELKLSWEIEIEQEEEEEDEEEEDEEASRSDEDDEDDERTE